MKISILILTYNEEANLSACLAALSWCDDIVVLDSGSTDATVEIASRHGARVLTRLFDDFAQQRNFGLAHGNFRHEWVLHLDADEVATPTFAGKLGALEPSDSIDAYRVPSKIIMHGHWLRCAGMYPTYQVRLGRRDRLRFKQVGHGQREDLPSHRVGLFDEPYLHFNFSHGLKAWLRKHIKYAEDEARRMTSADVASACSTPVMLTFDATSRRRALQSLAAHVPWALRPLARFMYVFFWRRGFLDGRYGFLYALMLAVYEGMIAVFAWDFVLLKRGQASQTGASRVKSRSEPQT